MESFAGTYKKSIANISCVLAIIFSFNTFAKEPVTTSTPVTSTDAASSTTAKNINAPTEHTSVSSAATVMSSTASPSVNAPKPAAQKPNSSSQLANLIGGLALIVALIYGLSWFVKRFTQGGFMQNPNMKIISTMPLGTRERLVLIDVGGKQLLLGVTATQINNLHVFNEPVVQPEQPPPAASEFSQKLMAILQQKNFTSPDDGPHKKSNS